MISVLYYTTFHLEIEVFTHLVNQYVYELIDDMKVRLTKSQIGELFELLGKNRGENSELYDEINDILRLYTRAIQDKLIEITINDADAGMIHEILKRNIL